MQPHPPRLRHLLHLLFLFSAVLTASLAAEKHSLHFLPVSFQSDQADQLNFLDIGSLFRALDRDDTQSDIIPFQPVRQTLIKEYDIDTFVSFSFRPEPNRNVTDYTPVIECDFPDVLNTSDVHLAPPVSMSNGRANYTATLSFERAVGHASLTILFQRSDKTVYTAISFEYTICGISFFYVDGGKRVLLPDNLLSIPSYQAVLNRQLYVFYCLVQFPDGSTSQQILSDIGRLPSLETIETDVKGDNIIPKRDFPTCKEKPYLKNDNVVLPDSCPFGFSPFTKSSQPYFAVRLLPYRTGSITFNFIWSDFLADFNRGEVYETSLTVSVAGKTETSVLAVTPSSPFRKAGGQLLHCTLINASPSEKYVLELGENQLHPISVKADNELVVTTFVTPKGSGQNIPWDVKVKKQGKYVSCPWASDGARFVFRYVKQDIIISSLSPNFGPGRGGTTITCTGYFADFSLERGDQVMFGSHRLARKDVISISQTSIVFQLPPRSSVDGDSFEVFCYVIVQGVRSNKLNFSYESLSDVRISVTGASYHAQNDTHMVPFCTKSDSNVSNASLHIFAHVNRGVVLQFLEFHWHLVVLPTKQEILTVSGGIEAQSISIPLRRISVGHLYETVVTIHDKRFQTRVTSSVALQPTYSRMLGIGLSIDSSRTLAYPPVDARITASLSDLGQCLGANKRLTYEWTFFSKKSSLSYESEDVARDAPSPKRLGREYIVPRSFLSYGEHEVLLRVFHTDNPDAFGTAVGKLSVVPPPVKAVIGSGESMLQVSSISDLRITGSNSHDRDSPFVAGQGLLYAWTCELSTEGGMEFLSSTDCPSDLMPERYSQKKSFVVSKSQLQTVKAVNGSAFLKFSLQVRKEDIRISRLRVSSVVSQVIEVIFVEDSLAEKGKINLSGPDNAPIDVNQVPYFEPVILSPQALEDTTWRFRVVEPTDDAATFLLNPDNLLHFPGFYKTSDLVSSRNALGIQGGALKANTRYTFEVEFQSKAAKHTSSVQFTFKTMPTPQLRFLSLSQTEGTSDTVFFAKAMPSVEDYSFKYYFYVRLEDGSEVCIDGCSGHRNVAFRVPVEGEHIVRCVLVDARGKYVLARAKETHKIIIRSKELATNFVASLSELLLDSLQLGDHGMFALASIRLATYAKTVDPIQTEESLKVGNLVSTTLEQLSELYRKSQTNTPLSKDYVAITRAFASLPAGHDGLATEGAFFHLCQMTYYAISNTPITERFDVAIDLNKTLSYLAVHARQLFSSGSSRERLVQGVTNGQGDVNEKLLELSEMTVPLWGTVRGRDAVCGEIISDEVGGIARVSTGTYCTQEHGLSMTGAFSRLDWCKGVYGKRGIQRTRVVLGEFRRDYISESGVQKLRRHISKIPTVNNGSVSISTDDMASHGFGIVRTSFESVDGVMHLTKGCLKLTQRVRPTADIFRAYGAEIICGSTTGLAYVNAKKLNERLASRAYAERSLPSMELNVSGTLARQAAVEVTSEVEANGHYGVKRKQCRHIHATTFGVVNGIWVPIVVTIGACLLTLVMMVGGVKVREARAIKVTAEAGNSAYIERDVYGREAHYMQDGGVEGNEESEGRSETRTSNGNSSEANVQEEDEVVFERKGSGGGG